MLEARHILHLRLDAQRLAAHREMPAPRYAAKPQARQFNIIGDAVITSVLGIDPVQFRQQLERARQFGAEWIGRDSQNRPVGFSAVTSCIRTGSVVGKNLIAPQNVLRCDDRLADHYVIAAFLNSGSDLDTVENVEVAGWATTGEILQMKTPSAPPSFQSKLDVVMMPCALLHPMNLLQSRLYAEPKEVVDEVSK